MPQGDVVQFEPNKKISKSQIKRLRRQKEQEKKNSLTLKEISPLTNNQRLAFDYWEDGYNIMLHGVAGTGKTFLGMDFSLSEVLNSRTYQKVVIVRSTVPTRDQGFLPGNIIEKARIYEQPYIQICSDLFGRADAYDILKSKGYIDFISTSYIRGSNLDNCIVLVDEIQNLNFHELDSVITRLGKNTSIILCGDIRQSDLIRDSEKAGLLKFKKIIEKMESFKVVEFQREDIVRSELVKSYIEAKLDLNIT